MNPGPFLVAESWLLWAFGLALLFPLLVIVLGEVAGRLERRGSPLAAPVRVVRNGALPVLVMFFFAVNVLESPADATPIKLIATSFWTVTLYAALALVNVLLFNDAKETSWRANVPTLLRDLSRLLLILLGVAIILWAVWGLDLGGLLTALGVGSIVIGLALQDTLGNLFAGVALLSERPYSEGDWIVVDDTVGRVVAINWRATRLLTRDGDLVTIPNGAIAGGTVLNEGRAGDVGYEDYFISFSYDDPPNRVKSVMLETIQNTPGVEAEPPPLVRTISYDDFSIRYQVRFAIRDFGVLPAVQDAFATRIWYAAQRGGLSIPFPIRTLYHHEGASAEAQAARARASLDDLKQFAPLGEDPADEAAWTDFTSLQHFGAGEPIFTEGDMHKGLYMVVAGQVQMYVEDASGTAHEVLRLTQGDLFGATTLLRGEPSPASFSALEDTELVGLDPEAVMRMVASRPAFARDLEELLEARTKAVAAVRTELFQLS